MKQVAPIEVEKVNSKFNLQNELSKLKIYVPFNELLRNNEYGDMITRMFKGQGEFQSDILELTDDNPTISFGPKVENMDDEEVPPFYLSLNVHDMVVHNAMLDSGASHNLMPKGVVESLGLEITRPYKYLYSFDSRRVKCLCLIKDMVVCLNKLPAKTVVMDVVVADIPPKFGVLLSRYWTSKLKGSLQMDMSYATIPVQNGNRTLYNEKRTPYVVINQDRPDVHHIYAVDTDLRSSIFFNDTVPCDLESPLQTKSAVDEEVVKEQDALEKKQKNKDCGPCILMGMWQKLMLVLVYI